MKRLVSACLLMLVLVLVPVAAHAQADAVRDRNSDVWSSRDDDFGWWNPDLAGVRIAHTRTRVTATVNFHRLNRPPYDVLEVRINTDRDPRVEYRLAHEPIFGTRGVYRGASSDRRVCGAGVRFNAARDFVRLSAPRSCFSKPRQLSAKAIFFEQVFDSDMVIDDTHWTARVRRG